ncbi:MAG: hypothetical protein E6344_02855 [Clostridium sp.]|nr:hypothetical protein [Clostridium sp.]MDU7082599.1 hypothetical protein [Clostridium sp.]
MSYIQEMLSEAVKKYPEMEVQDVLKLTYQSEFGCGHLIENKEASYTMLMDEWNDEKENDVELFEIIGNGYARFNVSAAKSIGISSKVFQRIFLKSAEVQRGTLSNFYEKVDELKRLCINRLFNFDISEIENFLSQWEESGRPLFRHSAKYRKLYKPSYRVVLEEYITMLPALMQIEDELNEKGKIIIGIDGPCGSGKTTFSNKLAELYNAQIIHMDDFFLPPALRTEFRLEEAGGNIHYERFLQEVVTKIKDVEEFKYRVFSCRRMDYEGEVEIKPYEVLIVEGSYSMHPLYNHIYDVKLYCDVEANIQKERIIRRNGLAMYRSFESKWIPMEEKYFNKFKIKEQCDCII